MKDRLRSQSQRRVPAGYFNPGIADKRSRQGTVRACGLVGQEV